MLKELISNTHTHTHTHTPERLHFQDERLIFSNQELLLSVFVILHMDIHPLTTHLSSGMGHDSTPLCRRVTNSTGNSKFAFELFTDTLTA